MPAPGTTNLVVSDAAGDALRQRARELSARLGRRVSLSEAMAMALDDQSRYRAEPAMCMPQKPTRPPTSESGVSASPDGRR